MAPVPSGASHQRGYEEHGCLRCLRDFEEEGTSTDGERLADMVKRSQHPGPSLAFLVTLCQTSVPVSLGALPLGVLVSATLPSFSWGYLPFNLAKRT